MLSTRRIPDQSVSHRGLLSSLEVVKDVENTTRQRVNWDNVSSQRGRVAKGAQPASSISDITI